MNNGGRWPWLAVLLLVLLVGASCGDGDSEGDDTAEVADTVTTSAETTSTAGPSTADDTSAAPETTASAPETTQARAETTAAPSPTESEPQTTTTAVSEPLGPPAPDFTLDLYGGGTFSLSQQTTPVVMIFWAEW